MSPASVGDVLQGKHGPLRVMAIAESYAMVRYKGAVPHIARLKDLSGLELIQANPK